MRKITQHLTVTFNKGISDDTPENLAPLPLLQKATNCVIEKSGELVSQGAMKKITQIPKETDETPAKIFTFNNHLLASTNKRILSFNSTTEEWREVSRQRLMDLKLHQIAQKEQDIKHLAFARLGGGLFVFYTFHNEILYKEYSPTEGRVIDGEKRFPFQFGAGVEVTGLAAYAEVLRGETNAARIWLGASSAEKIVFTPFAPNGNLGDATSSELAVANVKRFVLLKDKVFYTTDGTTILNAEYNLSANTPTASADEVATIRDPDKHAQDFSNTILYDFYDWCSFSYQGDNFKVVWSAQAGFFILNELNKIVGHYYSNFTPFEKSLPARMDYVGGAVKIEEKVFFPIMRAGQAEQVAGGGLVYPIGIELVELDFSVLRGHDVSKIDNQMIISGPILAYTDEQDVVENGFAEKPKIKLAPEAQYDAWPYGDVLDLDLPTSTELNPDQYSEFDTPQAAFKCPYTVEDVEFTAGTSGTKIGVGAGFGSWEANSANKRILRFGTAFEGGGADPAYGTLTSIYYDTSLKALVLLVPNPRTGLTAEKRTHLNGFLLDGTRYEVMRSTMTGPNNDRTSYSWVRGTEAPIKAGQKYKIRILACNLLRSQFNAQVQFPTEENGQKDIFIGDANYREFRLIGSESRERSDNTLGTSGFTPAQLNADGGWYGAIKSDLRDDYGIPIVPAGTTVGMLESFSVSTSSTYPRWGGADLDGNSLWVVDNGVDAEVIYKINLSTGRREQRILQYSSEHYDDLDRRQGNTQALGVCRSGNYLLVGDRRNERVFSYNISSGRYVREGNSLPDDWDIRGITNLNGVIYILATNRSQVRAYRADRFGNPGSSYITISNPLQTGNMLGFTNDGTNFIIPFRGGLSWHSPTGSRLLDKPRFQNALFGKGAAVFYENSVYAFRDSRSTLERWGTRTISAITNFGQLVSNTLTPPNNKNLEITGVWSDGTGTNRIGPNYYIAISTASSNYASASAFETALVALGLTLEASAGTNTYKFLLSAVPAGDRSEGTSGSNYFVRFNIKTLVSANAILKTILSQPSFAIKFVIPGGVGYVQNGQVELYHPAVFSMTFNSLKELVDDDLGKSVIGIDRQNSANRSTFQLTQFIKIDGSVSGRKYYYKNTSDNPLIGVNDFIYNFRNPIPVVRYRYTLERLATSSEKLLSAGVFKYKCRFKWLDQKGIEHRSQFSDELQLLTNQDVEIGTPQNQPTFEVNHLNLTNKPNNTISIEVYRTENKGQAFRLIKDLPNDRGSEKTSFVDDVEDKNLGQVAGPNIVLISGAKHCINYRGRFVLFNFPERPNRIIVSSSRQPFTNQAIGFKNAGIVGDTIEILMQSRVRAVRVMDQTLLIFTDEGTYTWTINENSLSQREAVRGYGHG